MIFEYNENESRFPSSFVTGLEEINPLYQCKTESRPIMFYIVADTYAVIQCLIEINCRPDEVIIYTDCSVLRGEMIQLGISSRHYITLKEGSGATNLTKCSICVEIKAITEGATRESV